MPEDRITTEAIAALTQGIAEFRKRQTEVKIINAASFARIMEMMEEMRAEMRSEIRQLKVHETRAEKQTIHQSTLSVTPAPHSMDHTLSSPPMVATPSDIGECGDIKGSTVDAIHDSKPNTVISYNVSRPTEMKIIVGLTRTLDRQVKVSANSSSVYSLVTLKLRNIALENSYGAKRLQISGYELNGSELSCLPTVCQNASMCWPIVIVDARFLRPPAKPPENLIKSLEVLSDLALMKPTTGYIVHTVDFSIVSGLNKREIVGWNEASGPENLFGVLGNTLSSCIPTVCENSSTPLLSDCATHMTNGSSIQSLKVFVSCIKPPAKPPDGAVLGKVDVRKKYELPQICAAFSGERRGSSMSLSGAGKVVCVTSAAGYIAFGLVKLLLQHGYTVKVSAHVPNDLKKTQHLTTLDGAKERLQLYKANLLEQGSFDPIVEGCEGVFHTALPFYHTMVVPHAELIDPAIKGTLNVFSSCAKVASLKRVILTSLIADVNGKPSTPEVAVDETWFSNPDVCKEMKLWYVISKTLAEEAAGEFVKEEGIDMVTINPAMVIGPLLQPTLDTSAAAILNLFNGSETYLNVSFGRINVKVVAEAHILAFESSSTNGRYCLVGRVAHSSEVVNMLHKLYPDIKLPIKCANDKLMEQLMAGADSTRLRIIGHTVVDLIFRVCRINKFGIFSSPRPPEVANTTNFLANFHHNFPSQHSRHSK